LAFWIWVLLTSRPIQSPSLNEKTFLFPEYNNPSSIKLPELNIVKLGGQQLTFGLFNLGLADIEADDLFKGRSQDEAALAFKLNFI
jgi:hypothetical protein